MNRRGFVGSVIGLLAGTQLPFVAKKATFKNHNDNLKKLNNYVRLFNIPIDQLHKCKIYAELEDGTKIWSPFILEVIRNYDTMQIKLVTKEIKATQTFTVIGCGLVDEVGVFVKDTKTQPIHLCKDETLKLTYTLNAGF